VGRAGCVRWVREGCNCRRERRVGLCGGTRSDRQSKDVLLLYCFYFLEKRNFRIIAKMRSRK
jgi:hypothetical protein